MKKEYQTGVVNVVFALAIIMYDVHSVIHIVYSISVLCTVC